MPKITTLSGFSVVVDLESRDFESYRNDVLKEGGLADAYLMNWSDRSELDMGVALTEVFSFMADNLGFYQDRCANECLWPSITQRRSIVEQSKLIGYELKPPISAQVFLDIEAIGAGVIPKGSVITSPGASSHATNFETVIDVNIPGPGTHSGILAVHGETITDPPYSSNGGPDQSIELGSKPLSLSAVGGLYIEVYVKESGPAELWTLVDNFIGSEPTDKVFLLRTDENDTSIVLFGDGITGKIPDAGISNILIKYRIGGGHTGNEVGPNTLTSMPNKPEFIKSITNPLSPQGGSNKESIEHAKIEAPRSLKALDRCVSHADYESAAKAIPGIRDAFAYQGDGVYEEVIVLVSSGSNARPTGTWDEYTQTGTGMLGSVGEILSKKKTTPVILILVPCTIMDIYLSMTVYLLPGAIASNTERLISDAISRILDVRTIPLGQQIPLSLVFDVVEGIQGVDFLDINRFQRQPFSRNIATSILAPSDVFLDDIIIGPETETDQFRISFIDNLSFSVYSENHGAIGTGTLGSVFKFEDKVSFTPMYYNQAPTAADILTLKTGKLVGNINPEKDVLARLKQEDFTLLLNTKKRR